MQLSALCEKLDQLLATEGIPDVSANGLQVETENREIQTIAFAVDASLAVFERAFQEAADLLIVHHGIFWGKEEVVTGPHGKRIRALLGNGLSLYAAHLPLDIHPKLGNNAELARLAGFTACDTFADFKGMPVGFLAEHETGMRYGAIRQQLDTALACTPFVIDRQPATAPETPIRKIALLSGSGARHAQEAADAGAELFISGEASHAAYHPALESSIPALFYGHYATETLGVRCLKQYLEETFKLHAVFIDEPTGL